MTDIWNTRRASLWLIGAVVIAQYALDAFFNLVVFREHWIRPVYRQTDGLINGTMIAYAIMLPAIVALLIFALGRMRPADVGLMKTDIRPAILWTLALWVAVNAVEAVLQTRHFAFDQSWSKFGAGPVFGMLIAQVFGNALYEEIVYRGFLTVQLMRMFERFGRARATASGVVVAQLIFASIHVPMLINHGAGLGAIAATLPVIFLLGIGMAGLYLMTGNLLIAVGVHALIDAPTLIGRDVSGLGDDFSIAFLLLALLAAIVWRSRAKDSVRSEAS